MLLQPATTPAQEPPRPGGPDGPGLEAGLRDLCRFALRVSGAPLAFLALKDGLRFSIAASTTTDPAAPPIPAALDTISPGTVIGQAAATGAAPDTMPRVLFTIQLEDAGAGPVGGLCLGGTEPLSLGPASLESLHGLARQASALLALARRAAAANPGAHDAVAQRFLAEATTLLTTSLDPEQTLERVAQLAVPHLSDWCTVDLRAPDGSIQRVAIAHQDPARVAFARDLAARYPVDPNAPHGVAEVLRTGRSLLLPDIPESLLHQAARDEDHLRTLRDLHPRSAMIVPMIVRGSPVGAISFLLTDPTARRFSEADLAFAEEIARRAASAIDSAWLYRQKEAAEARLRDLVNTVDGILWEADAATSRYTFVSQRAETLLGHPVDLWLASPTFWADHLHPLDREQAIARRRAEAAAARDHENEYRLIAADGRTVWVREAVYAVRDETGRARSLRGLMLDVTAQNAAVHRLAAQHAVTRILSEAGTLEAAADRILATVGPVLGWELGTLWTVEGRGDALQAACVWHAPTLEAAAFERATRDTLLAPGTGLPGRVFQSGKPDWVNDFGADARFPRARAASEAGIRAAFAIPLRSSGITFGVLEFMTRDARAPDEALLQVLEGIGIQVGQFAERKRAERLLREGNARRAAILAASLDCIITIDADGLILEWNPAAERTFGYTREEAIGKEMAALIVPERFRDMHRNGLARYVATRDSRILGSRVELPAIRKDGTEFPSELAIVPISTEDRIAFTGFLRDITARKRAEAAATESERRATSERVRLETVLQQMPAAVLIAEAPSGKILLANPLVETLLGSFPLTDGVPDYRGYQGFHPDGRPYAPQEWPLARSLATGEVVNGEVIHYLRPDGTRAVVLCNSSPIRGPTGTIIAGVAAFVDVTEERRAAETLREKEERLRAALDASVTGTFRWDMGTNALDWDENLNRLFGLPAGATARHLDQFIALVHPDDRPGLAATLDRCIREAADFDMEFRVVWPDGSIRWLLDRGQMIRDAHGKPLSMTGACTDITARKSVEEELRQHAMLLAWQRRVLESIATGAPLNETLEILCREAEAQVNGHHFTVLLVDADGTRLRHGAAPSLPDRYNAAVDGIAIAEGVGSCGTAAFRRAPVIVTDIATDPLWHDFRTLALSVGLRACWSTPILAPDGALLGTWAVYRTTPGEPEPENQRLVAIATRLAAVAIERARSEKELRYQRDLTKTITENAASALFMIDRQGHPLFMNPAAMAMTGYQSLDEIEDRPLHYAVHYKRPDGSPYPMEECPIDNANARITPLKDQKEIFVRKDGTLFPVEYNVAPVVKDNETFGAVIDVRDITAEVRAETELRSRAEELAALAEALERSNKELDQFAYVTSHDLKAPLRGIANLSRWIEEDLGESINDEARKHLSLLRGRVTRMEALIDGILEYSRVGRVRAKPETVSVQALVTEVVDLLSPPPGFYITIGEVMPTLHTERMRLQQVFMNLIGNAIKHHHRSEGRIEVTAEDAGAFWRFRVTDDGPGIHPRYHEKVFVIFQTLQARDKVEGTGVGLSLVKKIVEHQGGTVTLDSDEDKGATFTFTWPKHPRS